MRIFGGRSERKGLVFPGVKRFLFFFSSGFAFKLVTCLCLPAVLLHKVEIDFHEEALRNRLNRVTGYYRFLEERDMPPSLLHLI